MITYQNALVAVAAWCKANPGKACRVTYRQVERMGKTPESLSEWAEKHSFMLVRMEGREYLEIIQPL